MAPKTKPSIFQKIDEFVFNKIDILKKSAFYQKIRTPISQLEEEHPSILSNISLLIVIIAPLIIITIMAISNDSMRNEASLKKEIIEESNDLLENLKSINISSRKYFSQTSIQTLTDFNEQISNIANETGTDTSKVRLSNLSSENPGPNMQKTEVNMNFSQMTTSELFNFLNTLTTSRKIRISNAEISRNEENHLLSGQLMLLHFSYGKIPSQGQ